MTYIQLHSTSATSSGEGAGASTQPPHTELQGGQAVFSNQHYTVTTSDDGKLHVHNKLTGADTTLSAPPPPGGGEFQGSAAFRLSDGTVLRLDALPGTDGHVRRDLTISDGEYSVLISGVASARRVPTISERPAAQGGQVGYRESQAAWIDLDAGGLASFVDPLFRNAPIGLSPLGPPPIGATPEMRMGKTQTIAPLPPVTADEKEPTDLQRAMANLQAQYEDQLRANPELRSVYVSGIFVVDGREVKIQVAVDKDDTDDGWSDAPAIDLGDDTPPSRLVRPSAPQNLFGPPSHRGWA